MLARLVRGCIALAFTACVLADACSHRLAEAVKGGELSYMALAMEREQTAYCSLLMVAGMVLADPERMLARLVRGCIALAFTACVLAEYFQDTSLPSRLFAAAYSEVKTATPPESMVGELAVRTLLDAKDIRELFRVLHRKAVSKSNWTAAHQPTIGHGCGVCVGGDGWGVWRLRR